MAGKLNGIFISADENMARTLADLFCEMCGDAQADFFDEVAKLSKKWPNGAIFQWRSLQTWLTPEAKSVINDMKDHTDPEEVP